MSLNIHHISICYMLQNTKFIEWFNKIIITSLFPRTIFTILNIFDKILGGVLTSIEYNNTTRHSLVSSMQLQFYLYPNTTSFATIFRPSSPIFAHLLIWLVTSHLHLMIQNLKTRCTTRRFLHGLPFLLPIWLLLFFFFLFTMEKYRMQPDLAWSIAVCNISFLVLFALHILTFNVYRHLCEPYYPLVGQAIQHILCNQNATAWGLVLVLVLVLVLILFGLQRGFCTIIELETS